MARSKRIITTIIIIILIHIILNYSKVRVIKEEHVNKTEAKETTVQEEVYVPIEEDLCYQKDFEWN